jgi:hypothetical protein
MKSLFLSLIIVCLAASLLAETLPEKYSTYGKLIIAKLDSAPFPHPDRANGHDYHTNHYTTEKNYSDNSVAIFVPNNFHPNGKVDFVVHFYGWRHHIESTLAEYKLIEQFSKSGRNAILIVPQGPYDAADSFEGKLEDPDGFKRFMNDVMATLRKEQVIRQPLGNIILSGHSGGYHPVTTILARGGLADHVKEVWLFDALYGGTENVVSWFKKYPKTRFIDIYTLDGGTKEETEKLMASLKAEKPPASFLSKNEPDVTPEDLRKNHLVFIFSDLAHDHTVYEKEEFCNWLKTSSLGPIKILPF